MRTAVGQMSGQGQMLPKHDPNSGEVRYRLGSEARTQEILSVYIPVRPPSACQSLPKPGTYTVMSNPLLGFAVSCMLSTCLKLSSISIVPQDKCGG